jgi:TonB family protein
MIDHVRLHRRAFARKAFIVLLLFVVGMQLHAQPANDADGDSKRVDTSKASGSNAGSRLPLIDDIVEPEKGAVWDREALQHRIKYPVAAKKAGIQGTVIIRALIDTTGRIVRYVFDKKADDDLDSAALDAVRRTPFIPAMTKEGRPVAIWVQIEVNFRLE